jgi:hypothetical protein
MKIPELTPKALRAISIVLLVVPLVVLLILGIAEMVAGDVTGAQHFVMAAPLVLLLLAAWRHPRFAGNMLLVVGTVLLAAWLVLVIGRGIERGEILAYALTAVLVFGPPLLAGWLVRQTEAPPPRAPGSTVNR